MARLIVEQIVSADGTAADAEGGMSFLTPEATGGEADREQLRRLSGLSAIVLGANTYRIFAPYWPTASEEDDPIAGLINRLPKHVISNGLDAAPWGDHAPASIERGDAVDSLRRLKAAYPGEIILWGSLRLADAAFLAGEVDVLRLRILPSILGGGRGVVPEALPVTPLRLVSSSIHAGGQVALEYEVGAVDRTPAGS